MSDAPYQRTNRWFPRRRRRVLGCEPLEKRRLLAITVDTLVDELDGSIVDGDISLRDALAVAPSGETIDFDASLDGGTILLTLGELAVTEALTIDATALPAGLTIDASGNDPTPDQDIGDGSRIFDISDGDDGTDSPVTIRGLTLTSGDVSGRGGAISSQETLTVTNSTISGNSASRYGGIEIGLFRAGDDVTITIENSIVAGNTDDGTAPDVSGGIAIPNVRYSLIGDNSGTGLTEAPVGTPDADGNLIGDPDGMGIIDPLHETANCETTNLPSFGRRALTG